MKSINFKRKELANADGVEQPKRTPKKPKNWDRVIYISILLIILFFIGKYFVGQTFYIEAVGQVRFQDVKFRNTDDSRIMEFHKDAGDAVKIGDSLFTYIDARQYAEMNQGFSLEETYSTIQAKETSQNWIEREMYNLEKDISIKESTLIENQKLIDFYTKQARKVEEQVILDVVPKSEYTNNIDRRNKLIGENSALTAEIKIYEKQYESLAIRLEEVNQTGLASGSTSRSGKGLDSLRRVFKSPMEGTITELYKSEFEVALKSENILSIHKPENVYIKAFFDQEDLKELKEGDIVTLEFPDGTKSEGYIKKFYFSTYLIPIEFQNRYDPPTRTLSADIYPVNTEDLKKWRKFYKMRVTITKGKF
jgi:multidrug resistance efflux pump